MSQIKVLTDNSKSFSIISDGNVIGTLNYKHWYSANIEITIGEDNYTITRKGFWGTLHEVRHEDEVVFLLKAQWDGGIAMIKPKDKEHFYELKAKGYFVNGYKLINYKGQEMLSITPDFSWNRVMPSYTISCSDNFGSTRIEQLIIALSLYQYNAIQTMQMFAATN